LLPAVPTASDRTMRTVRRPARRMHDLRRTPRCRLRRTIPRLRSNPASGPSCRRPGKAAAARCRRRLGRHRHRTVPGLPGLTATVFDLPHVTGFAARMITPPNSPAGSPPLPVACSHPASTQPATTSPSCLAVRSLLAGYRCWGEPSAAGRSRRPSVPSPAGPAADRGVRLVADLRHLDPDPRRRPAVSGRRRVLAHRHRLDRRAGGRGARSLGPADDPARGTCIRRRAPT